MKIKMRVYHQTLTAYPGDTVVPLPAQEALAAALVRASAAELLEGVLPPAPMPEEKADGESPGGGGEAAAPGAIVPAAAQNKHL